MSENTGSSPEPPAPDAAEKQAQGEAKGEHSAPSTGQIRTVGQRRRDSEEKLEKHQQEARHKPTE
ncbi:hypothetical protein ASG92_02915 [Arthrobacter sp. Soil736]|uniref:hypothetical protein n=1 Tax=Arthrobacter sp. Soil736 TaxID=1736395 RepID=UPI0006FA90B3|nr:hypothetical protein [Arthrobacter sp. Soil736]KRE63883.1 hypothetical protein ASG92_02915 [Arthrobacter sp. Soil736]